MTSIEVFPTREQELVLDADDYDAHVDLGDITIYIPGGNHENHAGWLMGVWEQITDHMANHTHPTHLTNWVQKANK